jgi:opacity protein-like surface antigen
MKKKNLIVWVVAGLVLAPALLETVSAQGQSAWQSAQPTRRHSSRTSSQSVSRNGSQNRGPWGLGLNAGVAIPTQDFTDGVESGVGAAVGGEVFYHLNRHFTFGLDLDYEFHGARLSGATKDFGTLNTFSLLPFVEYHIVEIRHFSPYLSLGLGLNLNSFSLDSSFNGSGVTASVSNSFALRIGAGLDYFLSDHFALNTAFLWKLNSSTLKTNTSFGSPDFNASSFGLLFGAKYFF